MIRLRAPHSVGPEARHAARADDDAHDASGLHRVLSVATWVGEVALYAQIMLILTVTVFAVLFHTRPIVIVGGSMEPAISVGDVVMMQRLSADDDLLGAVVTFTVGEQRITHRVVGQESDSRLLTRGDANPTNDPMIVRPDQIEGRARLVAPYVGLPVVWKQQGNLGLMAIWLSLTFLALALTLSDRRRSQSSSQAEPTAKPIATPNATPPGQEPLPAGERMLGPRHARHGAQPEISPDQVVSHA